MPPQYLPGLVEVAIKAQRDGLLRVNVWNFRNPSGAASSLAELTQLINGIDSAILNKLRHTAALGTIWTSIVATDRTAPNGIQAIKAVAHAGDGGAQVFPAQVSIVMSKRTAFSGRARRGRHFFFDLPEDYLNGSTVNPTYQAVLYDTAETLKGPHGAVGFVAVVYSAKLNTMADITSFVLNPVAATQTRRLPGHGV